MRSRNFNLSPICRGILCFAAVGVAWGQSANSTARWFADAAAGLSVPTFTLAGDEAATTQPTLEKPPEEEERDADTKPGWLNPVSFDITYSLYSDYIFRGLNLSEFEREGREDPNHQLTTSLTLDIAKSFGRDEGEFGSFAFDTFFEWYAGQDVIDPLYGDHNCQEIDYTVSYAYEFKPIFTTLTGGYVWYAYPNHREIATSEWFFRIEHNDAWMWKGLWPENEGGVFNPYLSYWQDADLISHAAWWQFGFSHEFEVLPDVTLTPTVDFGVDHHWLHPTLDSGDGTQGLATIQYGLSISYDMSELIRLKQWGFGSVVWSGFMFYSDAVGNPRDDHLTADEFYGGTSIGWSF